jgi:[FeFe] hydrogenase H-cluster maturation GTPase HydF
MSLNQTPTGERIHIGIFGKRNAGKSSLINAITNQETAIVSPLGGTTTDPVQKAMEILPLGPVVLIDTPGLDDDNKELGGLRIQRAIEVLNKTDIALLVVDAICGISCEDMEILEKIKEREIPYIIVFNKIDLSANAEIATNIEGAKDHSARGEAIKTCMVSAVTKDGIRELKTLIGSLVPKNEKANSLVGDLILQGDCVVLVIPIDEGAPKGRLILPQQQVIRDILDNEASVVVAKESQLAEMLKTLSKTPALVITDSQIFDKVKEIVPPDIMLTSFSILFARYKGVLEVAVEGALALKDLKRGAKVLISEGCTHHRQCNDIGTVKLPKWIQDYVGEELEFQFTQGKSYPSDLKKYSCIVHCGDRKSVV